MLQILSRFKSSSFSVTETVLQYLPQKSISSSELFVSSATKPNVLTSEKILHVAWPDSLLLPGDMLIQIILRL
jgi:hypothetical protein